MKKKIRNVLSKAGMHLKEASKVQIDSNNKQSPGNTTGFFLAHLNYFPYLFLLECWLVDYQAYFVDPCSVTLDMHRNYDCLIANNHPNNYNNQVII